MLTFIRLLLVAPAVMALPAQANGYLDSQCARLSFNSTRITSLCEVPRFLKQRGSFDPKGADPFVIGSASVGAVLIFRAR